MPGGVDSGREAGRGEEASDAFAASCPRPKAAMSYLFSALFQRCGNGADTS
jgi:hypothetical protein